MVVSADTTSASSGTAARRIPLTIPLDQEYYWRFSWQVGEREAAAERDAGERVRFESDDPEDVARWLDSPEDDAGEPDAD